MLLNALISELREYKPDWTERYMIHQINSKRAQLLKNRLNQGIKINDSIKQVIPDVGMQIADNSDVDLFTTNSRVLVSRDNLPSLVSKHNEHAFLRVRNPKVVSERFNVKAIEELGTVGYGRFNQRSVFVAWYNSRIYVPLLDSNPKLRLITTLSVEGVFEDPLEVMSFINPELEGRDFWFQDYPITVADWNYIKNMILSDGTVQEE